MRLQRAIGLPDNPLLVFLVAQIAKANYPPDADPEPILVPVVDRREIARVTAEFLERKVGTVSTLYRAIWGMGTRAYISRFEEIRGDEPPRTGPTA